MSSAFFTTLHLHQLISLQESEVRIATHSWSICQSSLDKVLSLLLSGQEAVRRFALLVFTVVKQGFIKSFSGVGAVPVCLDEIGLLFEVSY